MGLPPQQLLAIDNSLSGCMLVLVLIGVAQNGNGGW